MTWLLFFVLLAGSGLVGGLVAAFPHVFFGVAACAFITWGGYSLAIAGDIVCACLLLADGAMFGWFSFELARMNRTARTTTPPAKARRPTP